MFVILARNEIDDGKKGGNTKPLKHKRCFGRKTNSIPKT